MFLRSLKFQISLALSIQILVLIGIVSTTLYLLDLRKHDYVILSLSGQLRVISETLARESLDYSNSIASISRLQRQDQGLYKKNLQQLVNRYDRIIQSFKARQLQADVVSPSFITSSMKISGISNILANENPIYCKWDTTSRNQLDATAAVWRRFHRELLVELGEGNQAGNLSQAAQYILLNEQNLEGASTDLTIAFRSMMEEKHRQIVWLNRAAILFTLIVIAFVAWLLKKQVFNPIDTAVHGVAQVAKGNLGQRIAETNSLELGKLTSGLNFLSQRLHALFQLTDRINQANSLDKTLEFIFQEFGQLLPIEWVGLLSLEDGTYRQTHSYAVEKLKLLDGSTYSETIFINQANGEQPSVISIDLNSVNPVPANSLAHALQQEDMQSLIILPLNITSRDHAVLVFASRYAHAYPDEDQELLGNIAGQVSHAFDRTIGIESLIISAIEGLAKLAESRDPETGDHLFRMSHYSAIIAEQLSKTDKYKDIITPAYVQEILRFAPMHDIGKVGIEDSILLKPAKLTDDEFTAMQQHPLIGANVLRRCEEQVNKAGLSIFKLGIEIAEGHHEKFNGTGYPFGKRADDIPLSARIVATADVFDALTSRRPYKQAWDIDTAIAHMRNESGAHFDPEIIDALELAMPAILNIYNTHKHI